MGGIPCSGLCTGSLSFTHQVEESLTLVVLWPHGLVGHIQSPELGGGLCSHGVCWFRPMTRVVLPSLLEWNSLCSISSPLLPLDAAGVFMSPTSMCGMSMGTVESISGPLSTLWFFCDLAWHAEVSVLGGMMQKRAQSH